MKSRFAASLLFFLSAACSHAPSPAQSSASVGAPSAAPGPLDGTWRLLRYECKGGKPRAQLKSINRDLESGKRRVLTSIRTMETHSEVRTQYWFSNKSEPDVGCMVSVSEKWTLPNLQSGSEIRVTDSMVRSEVVLHDFHDRRSVSDSQVRTGPECIRRSEGHALQRVDELLLDGGLKDGQGKTFSIVSSDATSPGPASGGVCSKGQWVAVYEKAL